MKIKRKLETREDVALLLLDWIRPLKGCYSEGRAELLVGNTAAHYGEAAARMEGFSRILWGLAPLFAGEWKNLPAEAKEEIRQWQDLTRTGLINGTDPAHPEYWRDVWDYDQKMVEMAALVNAVLLAPKVFWDPLTDNERDNLCHWLGQINDHGVHPNNWRFFRILVNVLLLEKGYPADEKRLQEDLAVIENCYEGDGWYFDGHAGQKDYYIPFAMHYYGLLFSRHMAGSCPEYCTQLRIRAAEFYRDFLYWFDGQGREVPYGRSLTYRFAHSAAFAAMAYADVKVPMGELRHMILGNLRYWSEQEMFDRGGVLTIGYEYPNLLMSECYNAPGSPYWSFKTFLILALDEGHPFWTTPESTPQYEEKKLLSHPNMIAVHEKSGHTLLYVTGQQSGNFGNTPAKYQKFVYSNRFGFSVSRGNELDEGAFDNTLAASEAGDHFWQMRRSAEKFEVTEDCLRTKYCLLRDVQVESIIVPLQQGHLRIHYIDTNREIELADGGFAITPEKGKERSTPDMTMVSEKEVQCRYPWGYAGALCLTGEGKAQLVHPMPNTNLMKPLTCIPTIIYTLPAGNHCLIDFFYGDMEMQQEELLLPEVRIQGEQVEILDGKNRITVKGQLWK